MKNLNRALRMTLNYRWSLIFSLICSVMVATLWSLNLGAIYPFVEVVLKGHSLHEWVEEQEAETTRIITKKSDLAQTLLVAIEQSPANDSNIPKLRNELAVAEYDIKIAEAQSALVAKLSPWIDSYAPRKPFATLACLMFLMFSGTILRGFFLIGSTVLVARVGQRTMLDMQNNVFQNVLNMEASELGVKGTGDLISRIRGETGAICQAVIALFGKTVREPLKMICCFAGAALINWRLLIFSMLICPIAAFLMLKLAKVLKRANRIAMEESARLLDRLYQALTYIRVVKAFTNEDNERTRFKVVAQDVYKRSMRISLYTSLSRVNNELLGVSMITLSVLAGGYLVLNSTPFLGGIRLSAGPMSFGSLMAFFGFMVGIADPLRKMGDVYNMIQGGIVAADRVFPLIDQVPNIRDPEMPQSLPEGPLGIEFNNVHFEYEFDKLILNGLSESVPAGTSLAIVGHNGCGKSTLINLIPRFFDVCGKGPESGSIQIGGVDVRNMKVKTLRDNVGYVTQKTMLFNDTIAENISYGQPFVDPVAIESAARRAHAHEFIQELDEGYNTSIGEHGGKLSGGQCQRISLARAILKDPRILILDEATSQIDPESEQLIHETLAEFIKGRTTVVITHRMSTLELVDRILLMKDGQVVDCGTHEQLLARCPDYQRMRNLGLQEVA